jgi:hypothetical protein
VNPSVSPGKSASESATAANNDDDRKEDLLAELEGLRILAGNCFSSIFNEAIKRCYGRGASVLRLDERARAVSRSRRAADTDFDDNVLILTMRFLLGATYSLANR